MKTGLNMMRVTLRGGNRHGRTVSVPRKATRATYADESYGVASPAENDPQTGFPVFNFAADVIDVTDLPLESLVSVMLMADTEVRDRVAVARALREMQPEGMDVAEAYVEAIEAHYTTDEDPAPQSQVETAVARFWQSVDGAIQAHGGLTTGDAPLGSDAKQAE